MYRVLYLIVVIVLVGCSPKLNIKNVQSPTLDNLGSNQKPKTSVDIMIEPYESISLIKTPAIENGQFSVFMGIFPQILFGEYTEGRIRWNGWCMDEDGNEYFSQFLFSGLTELGKFLEIIVIDGLTENMKNPTVMGLSTGADYAYDLENHEYALEPRFNNNHDFRQQFILTNGTKVSALKKVSNENFLANIKNWSEFKTDKGDRLLTPPVKIKVKNDNGEETELDYIEYLAKINPQYSKFQKWIAITKGSISSDPISSAAGLALEIYQASRNKVPTTGLDFKSKAPYLDRRELGTTISFALQMQQELIKYYYDQNSEMKKYWEAQHEKVISSDNARPGTNIFWRR